MAATSLEPDVQASLEGALVEQVVALVEACVDTDGMRLAPAGPGFRFAAVIDPDGLNELVLEMLGEAAGRPGLQDCLQDVAWELQWPDAHTEVVMTEMVVSLSMEGPPDVPPEPLIEPSREPILMSDLPPEDQAILAERLGL